MDNISLFLRFNPFCGQKALLDVFQWTFYPSETDWIHLAIAISYTLKNAGLF